MDFSEKKVAVIMPAYNGEKYLQEQLDSILNQSFQNFSLFVFDDASTDQTPLIVIEQAKKDGRVHFYQNPKQKGVIRNINDALTEIAADIYFLADQDDIWRPEKMAKQMKVLEQEEVILTFTNLSLIDEDGRSLGDDFWSTQEINASDADNADIIAIKTIVTGCTIAFKKELLDIALPIPEQATMHDHWLSFFAAKKGRVVPISEELVQYRQHSHNVIGAAITPMIQRSRRYEGCVSFQDYRDRKNRFFVELLRSIGAFQKRLEEHEMDPGDLKKYIAFYDSLIHRQWLTSFRTTRSLEVLPNANGFLRTLILTIFFPLVFLVLKYILNAGNTLHKS